MNNLSTRYEEEKNIKYRLPCSKCGSDDYPKHIRMKKRDNGQRTISKSTYCIICHYEDQKVREEARYDKKLAYNRQWRKDNRDKKNEYDRTYYWKKKGKWVCGDSENAPVEWKLTKNSGGFSSMTYTPLFVSGDRSSIYYKK